MPLPEIVIWVVLALGVAALCISAWRSWEFNRIARMMLSTWQVMVNANAKKADIEHEQAQQALHVKSQTMGEQVELERVALARQRAVEYNALEEELKKKGHDILQEYQEIGQKLTENIPSRHPATVLGPDRPRPPATAVSGNGGRHRKDSEPADTPG